MHADCGAGVGRVSEQLLLHHFNTVDLLEPSRHLIDAAQKNIKAAIASGTYPKGHAVGHCLCQGLQQFVPEPQRCDGQLLFLYIGYVCGARRGGADAEISNGCQHHPVHTVTL
eukprot:GHUV01025942.1.p2 GENE.GHUV01025942.1~~GHUV01025942.1.p2  ORF type:complete len:113 (+),score=30.55 GHUV01025942.1:1231-1569(+)